MDKFKHLDSKTIELAVITASIAGGCLPRLNYHFDKALETGYTIGEEKEAIKLGKMINIDLLPTFMIWLKN